LSFMTRSSGAVHAAALVSAAAALLVVSACGDDEPADEASAGSGGALVGGSSSASGKSGSGSTDEAGAVGTNGGSTSGGAEQSAAGEPGNSSAGSGAATGSSGAPAGGAAGIETPGPAPGGGSVYAVECSGDTAMCGVAGAHCLGISLDTGDKGYACSNRCNTVDDCSDAPSGAEAEAGCIQFTQEKRCVLVCYNQPNEYECPDGMSCYIYPNSPIGYCLWTQ
jgi:hypothetical protein